MQGADLAKLLAEAEQFDAGVYFRCDAWQRPGLHSCTGSNLRCALAAGRSPLLRSPPPALGRLISGCFLRLCRARVNLARDVGLPPDAGADGYQVGGMELQTATALRMMQMPPNVWPPPRPSGPL